MKHRLATTLIATIMLASAPILATPPAQEDPQTLASEGIQQLIRAMELMLLAIPQFEAPEINENGDIIIRRKHPERQEQENQPSPRMKGKAI